jgi:hypothetical protein
MLTASLKTKIVRARVILENMGKTELMAQFYVSSENERRIHCQAKGSTEKKRGTNPNNNDGCLQRNRSLFHVEQGCSSRSVACTRPFSSVFPVALPSRTASTRWGRRFGPAKRGMSSMDATINQKRSCFVTDPTDLDRIFVSTTIQLNLSGG